METQALFQLMDLSVVITVNLTNLLLTVMFLLQGCGRQRDGNRFGWAATRSQPGNFSGSSRSQPTLFAWPPRPFHMPGLNTDKCQAEFPASGMDYFSPRQIGSRF